MTTAELTAAPTDPARLREWLTGLIRRGGVEPTDAALYWAGESLVMNLPATPLSPGSAGIGSCLSAGR